MKVKTRSEKETKKIAAELAKKVKKGDSGKVIKLSGQLGSGKTTFVKGFANELGISEITSPTFVIMKKYDLNECEFETLYHIDCYRLDEGSSLKEINFEDILNDKNNLILIEWPERIDRDLKGCIQLKFEALGKKERAVEIPDSFDLQNKVN